MRLFNALENFSLTRWDRAREGSFLLILLMPHAILNVIRNLIIKTRSLLYGEPARLFLRIVFLAWFAVAVRCLIIAVREKDGYSIYWIVHCTNKMFLTVCRIIIVSSISIALRVFCADSSWLHVVRLNNRKSQLECEELWRLNGLSEEHADFYSKFCFLFFRDVLALQLFLSHLITILTRMLASLLFIRQSWCGGWRILKSSLLFSFQIFVITHILCSSIYC